MSQNTTDPLIERYRRKITPATRRAVIDAADGCAYCGSPFVDDMELDHIIPVSLGGSDDIENLAAACPRCNREKAAMTPSEWERVRTSQGKPWPPPNVNACAAALVDGLVTDGLADRWHGREEEAGRIAHRFAVEIRDGANLDEQRARLATALASGGDRR